MAAPKLTNYLNSKGLLLLKSSRTTPLLLADSRRGVRGVMRTIRTPLPKYKKDLMKLPALTQLLTAPPEIMKIDDPIKIRLDKLEIYKQYLPLNSNTNLIEAIFHRDNDIDRLLRIIDENLNTMTSFYLAVSFEALDDMMRAQLCDPSTVAASPELKRLCTKTLYKMRFFEADEIIKLLKCVATLQVPEDTLLVQAALQMARHLINDFDPSELVCLDQVLDTLAVKEGKESRKCLLLAVREASRLRLALAKQRGRVAGFLPPSSEESAGVP